MINSQVLSNFYYGVTVVICIIIFNFIVPNLKFILHPKYVNTTEWIKEKYCVWGWFGTRCFGGGAVLRGIGTHPLKLRGYCIRF